MQTARFIESLQADLRELAALGDENVAAAPPPPPPPPPPREQGVLA